MALAAALHADAVEPAPEASANAPEAAIPGDVQSQPQSAEPDAGAGAGSDAGRSTSAPRLGASAATRAALVAGVISAEHAMVIDSTLSCLPAGVDAAVVARGEALLAEEARKADPQRLAMVAKHLLHTLDPDRGKALAVSEAAQVAARELWVTPKSGGGYVIKGELDPELGASLLSALGPYARPRPSQDGMRDLRTPAQRNADALGDVIRLAVSSPDVGTVAGDRPTVVVTLDYATLTRQLAAAGATLEWAGPLSAEAARRLACDARVIPMVLGGEGQPLDVGRSSYTATAAIRRALTARDQGCAFVGCDRPPGWADAHHIVHWADGGETKLSNMVLLCGAHHRAVHHDGWIVRIAPNGLPEFIPPRWIDRTQTPRSKPGRASHAALLNLPH